MMRSRKLKANKTLSTQQLMGIDRITDYCVSTPRGDLVFFVVQPTNISVLPESGIQARIHALLNVLRSQTEVELLALNSRESFDHNQAFYRSRLEQEKNIKVRALLEQDCNHLDQIQVLSTLAREFYLVIRLKGQKESVIFPYLSRIEKSIQDNGFSVHRADKQELKRLLAVYFEQNVTTEQFQDYDGQHWLGKEADIHAKEKAEALPRGG